MPFLEVQFPTDVSFLASGGPSFSTNVNKGLSGAQQRNRNWSLGLGKWKIDLHYKPYTYFQSVYALWLNVGGGADGFRFKDHKDFQAFGQFLGEGDGSTTTFQLQNQYAIGGRTYLKPILKPVTSQVMRFDGSYCADTVVCYLDGVAKQIGVDYTVDWTTGLVTFNVAPHGPGGSPATVGAVLTADFEFDYAVRFVSDDFTAQVEESDVADGNLEFSWPSIDLEELRDVPPGPWGAAGPPPSLPGVPPFPTPAAQEYLVLYPTQATVGNNGIAGTATASANGLSDSAYVSVSQAGGLASLEQPSATLSNFALPSWLAQSRLKSIWAWIAWSAVPDPTQPGIWYVGFGPAGASGTQRISSSIFEQITGIDPTVYDLATLSAAGHIVNSVWPATVNDQLGFVVAVVVYYE